MAKGKMNFLLSWARICVLLFSLITKIFKFHLNYDKYLSLSLTFDLII
jgi:hypothetical protein